MEDNIILLIASLLFSVCNFNAMIIILFFWSCNSCKVLQVLTPAAYDFILVDFIIFGEYKMTKLLIPLSLG